MKTFKVIQIKSDNFDGLVTREAYEEIRLQMSTGDFHTHKHSTVTVDSLENVVTVNDMFDDPL